MKYNIDTDTDSKFTNRAHPILERDESRHTLLVSYLLHAQSSL